ncbi:MAG TPA: Mur ligase family protein [Stellaceae bacterium]|nr:Mur ligase family protein [Stellaceae bacterium]
MDRGRSYFFCGIGGSGMLPLALLLRGAGLAVAGSDRALDQGRTTPKFDFLRAQGIPLFRQDGSGITDLKQILVTSAAVESAVPDVVRARAIGAPIMTRAALLAELFNAAPQSIGVAGTSGKSTTTGMIGWILKATGLDPTIMNGAVMKNFVTPALPFASAAIGRSGIFVSEIDESDGSIASFTPHLAVLNNIALDHKSLDELRALFRDFVAKAAIRVLNLDQSETEALVALAPPDQVIGYGIGSRPPPRLRTYLEGGDLTPAPDGIRFTLKHGASRIPLRLAVPGRHNVANALASMGAAEGLGIDLRAAAAALERFTGIRRRLEIVGESHGITVIDDFAHNPDKIAATLDTLHAFPGRLLVMFQPHGFGPLRAMKDGFIEVFTRHLHDQDVVLLPDPLYFGGTVERSVGSRDIAEGIAARGRRAQALPDRTQCGERLLELARPGDRIVVMGARDDTLSHFAAELLGRF